MAKTVLVTGGSGYVAKWCIVELLRQGHDVRTTLRDLKRASDVRAAIQSVVENTDQLSFVAADLLDDAGWDSAMAGCEHVLHVASPLGGGVAGDRNSFVGPARDGTLRVLKAAVRAGVKRVVMTSAAATARPPLGSQRVSDETIWADPEDSQFDAYRISKILAERAAWDFMERHGEKTEFATVLPGAVFGPVLSADNLGSVKIISDLLKGQPKAVPKLGFWVVDVRDLADLHIKALRSPEAAGQRFIAAGEFLWMVDIARILRDGLGADGRRAPMHQFPTILLRLVLPFLPRLRPLAPLVGRKFLLSAQKARTILGFEPRPAKATIIDCAQSLIHQGLTGKIR